MNRVARELMRMKYMKGFKPAWVLLVLAIMSLAITLECETSKATNWYNVTVRIVGLYPNVATKVYASGHQMGTIYGEGTLTFNSTYGPTISVDGHVPDGYPYYGYPYYGYPGPFWGPYGHDGVAFHCPVKSQTAYANSTAPVTLTFRYDPLFFLYVKSEKGSPEGTGWYPAGMWAHVAVTTPSEESGLTRYRFDKWSGGYFRDSANNAVNFVYMDSPKIVEAVWVTQYKLAVNSAHGEVSGGGWYDKDQVATFSVASPVGGGEGIRHIFNSWTGDYTSSSLIGTVAMNAPKTVTATWKTQFLLSVDPKGGQVDKSTQWLDSGTSISVSALSPSSLVEKKSRLVFSGWQGSSTSTFNTVTLVMDSPKSLIATWRTQYYLIVETKHGTPRGEGWYDADSVAEFSVPDEVPMEPPLGSLGGKYVFSGWTGDSTASTPRATILMDGARTVTALWTSDYTTVTIFFVAVAAAGVAAVVLAAKRGKLRQLRKVLSEPKSPSSTGNKSTGQRS